MIVVDKEEHSSRVKQLLENKELYIKSNQTQLKNQLQATKSFVNKLISKGYLTPTDKQKLIINTPRTPIFKGAPKIHKENCPLRPIVDGHLSHNYFLAQWLAKGLNKYRTQNKHVVTNSLDFKNLITAQDTSFSDDKMLSLDVIEMYPKIPLQEAIDKTVTKFEKDENKELNITPELLQEGLTLASEQIFTYDNEYYKQKDGLTIGSAISPILADVHMEDIETDFLNAYHNNISLYVRYVDDTFLLWNGTNTKFKSFFEYINGLHPTIKFTSEWETAEGSLNFLDLHVQRNPGSHFTTNIYRKPMAICRPIHFSSIHHPAQKWGTLTSATLRARKLISLEEHLWTELKFLRSAYLDQGYPLHLIHKTMFKSLKKELWLLKDLRQDSNNKLVIRKMAPYIPSISKFNNKNWNSKLKENELDVVVQCSYQPDRNLLSRLNTNQSSNCLQEDIMNQSGLVYGVKCLDCQDKEQIKYVGETSRKLKDRIYSHFHDRSNPSALRNHREEEPYHSNLQYQILGKELVASRRKILESLLIKKYNPVWNGDRGIQLYCV